MHFSPDLAKGDDCGDGDFITIAQVGCTHGALDLIYRDIERYQMENEVEVDLLLCCGDFEACRNAFDLSCLSGPAKYHVFKDFYKYYSGEKEAPILTIFIGGNHEACNHLRELYYGGWAAPNIYFLGYSGVVQYRGVRLAGFSGIFKSYGYNQGHHEVPPYRHLSEKKSAFHVKSYELWKLKQIQDPIDILLSHDWPNVVRHGDTRGLLRRKPYFTEDVKRGTLGAEKYNQLMSVLQPKFWLSGHMHCFFEASVEHANGATTRFRALDKPLPKRKYLDYLRIPCDGKNVTKRLCYDPEWLSVICATHELFPMTKKVPHNAYASKSVHRKAARIRTGWEGSKLENPVPIPFNFEMTVDPHVSGRKEPASSQPFQLSPQTIEFLTMLELDPSFITPREKKTHKSKGTKRCDEGWMRVSRKK